MDKKRFPDDLSGEILREVDLSGADLSGAKLYNANLTDANLSGANLDDDFWENNHGN